MMGVDEQPASTDKANEQPASTDKADEPDKHDKHDVSVQAEHDKHDVSVQTEESGRVFVYDFKGPEVLIVDNSKTETILPNSPRTPQKVLNTTHVSKVCARSEKR